jgi:two-component sensor histidine kinase
MARALATAKGWLFILVTSLLLYSLVSGELARRARLEADLQARLAEKVVLLREIHHRVNNNLQVVGSILALEADLMESSRDRGILEEARERVIAMGMVHGSLSRHGDLNRIDVGAWLGEILPGLADALGAAALLDLDLGSVEIDIDLALPCGLVAAEALSNAVRHGGGSRIGIVLRSLPGQRIELELRDGGPGFPAEQSPPSRRGIGLLLAEALAAQMGGSLRHRNDGGAVLTLAFSASGAQPAA